MDYEKVWNELKDALETSSANRDIPIDGRIVLRDTLATMSKLNSKYTTIYIKELQSTRP